ncbi:bis(5'-nucleosyl)-tetraphosphatase [Lactobacillus hominis]|uniref:Bis(5'-nucleosyl)-tetraphosphatase [asymmetrical] n=1 Tax=Lactobacillus hominis DSM 23910 = CRBIP 24.179 TaxID=1423758 RepID=I7L4V9_9LACO|nr:NUDIX domain-containing protein [Lactobacillus hominis]KRM86028.1 nudix family protein [Lactobacillus hominis DSM 23910 = CRBIP 24.179]MCT3348746.1 NUDIX domain-containing protein [Lactobacillus hominis]CCI81017.1 Nudix family protein [Lactobacillus hominis DSM 23910 = CRBIP 24.179]
MAKEYSAGAIIYRENNGEREFLIVQSIVNNNWGFAKGHIEAGENAQTAAQREVLEEVGLTPEFDFNFSAQTQYVIPNGNEKEVTLFLAFAQKQEVKTQKEEIKDFKWVSFDQASEYLQGHGKMCMLKQANEYIDQK